jgi:hypothetical protein
MRTLGFLVLVAAGCDDPVVVVADEVVTGLDAFPAMLVADGETTAVVTVRTAPDVTTGLDAKLTLRGATWLGVDGSSIERDLSPDGEASAVLVASRHVGTAIVVAEIAGYERTLSLSLVEAVPHDLTYTTSGQLEDGKASTIQFTVQPIVATGLPSAGTVIEFSLVTVPADTGFLTTSKVVLDASETTVSTTAMTGTTTTGGSLEVRVFTPTGTSPLLTRTISFGLLP